MEVLEAIKSRRSIRKYKTTPVDDETLERTTDAPAAIAKIPVSKLLLNQVEKFDAGSHFSSEYEGESIPLLKDVLSMLALDIDQRLYLDLKGNVDWDILDSMIEEKGVQTQIIFANGDPGTLVKLKKKWPETKNMTWLGGNAIDIKQKFEDYRESGFAGIDQLQFHLKVKQSGPVILYEIEPEYLTYAHKVLSEANVALQVRPFEFKLSWYSLVCDRCPESFL